MLEVIDVRSAKSDIFSRRHTTELAKIVDEMGLVEIA
jgi:hypothetical protein